MSGTTGQTTTLRDYWRVLKRRRWLVLASVTLAVGAANVISVVQDPVYSASTEVLIQPVAAESLFGSSGVAADESNRSGETAITLLKGDAVAAYVQQELGLSTRPPAPDGQAVEDTDVVIVSVEAGDAASAAVLADTYAEGLIEVRREQSIAGLNAAAAELQTKIDVLDVRIADLDVEIAAAEAATAASIGEYELQVDALKAQIAQRQLRLIELNVLPALTVAEQIEQQTIQLDVTNLQLQADELGEEINNLRSENNGVLQQSRQRLADQQTEFSQLLDEVNIDASLASGSAQVVRPAAVPAEPVRPRPIFNAIIGLIAGLIIGMALAFLREYFDDSIKSPADLDKLDTDLALLAVIPNVAAPDERPIALTQPNALSVEAFRSLRTNVQFLSVDREVRVLEVVSARSGEGKTTVASNLAVVLSQAGNTVALVDADLRKPRVHRMFDVDSTLGLTNSLAGESIDLTIQPLTQHLAVLVAGPIPPNPSELLSSRRMKAIIAELRLRYDYVVIDSAPLLAVSDGIVLAQLVDGVIVVAQAGRTSASPLDQAISSLTQVSAPVLGVVLNRAKARDGWSEGYAYVSAYSEPPQRVLPAPSEPVHW